MARPKLPAKAAYITLKNPNASSLSVLRDLRQQLHHHLTSPRTGRLLTLPPFKQHILNFKPTDTNKDTSNNNYTWLTDPDSWRKEREDLPNVLVLRTTGPIFSAGEDPQEPPITTTTTRTIIQETLALRTEITSLIRHSPAPIITPIKTSSTVTPTGLHLSLTTDFPIALANTEFQLPPPASTHLATSLPAMAAISRRLPPGLAYRLFALGGRVSAGELGRAGGVLDVVPVPEHAESTDTAARALEERVAGVVARLAADTAAGRLQALGKWAYWTQLGIDGGGGAGEEDDDGYEAAEKWAGAVMAEQSQG
ncbi:Enoyl-CoA hydratase domain-containing protein 3, mitochondrial [Cytospora mali]|uniref:Enoyl-CoA hydratase domain-containing protein 3, mitochondrial n=1 Tax=Cytospora mali TaxID=578113 RepID=A0A194VC08_CYTMA|nr:Enoyl-CoA hydratase domain-containing protein 3, mitochondrial [Valsa mali var. pyri (nom. inval.)]